MVIFYLIRHGNKKDKKGDFGLTELGRSQALATGLYFKKYSIDEIYSSPSTRAIETAEIISGILNLRISVEDSLCERMEWISEDQSFEDFIKEWDYSTYHPSYKPKNGYSVNESISKMRNLLMEIGKKSEGKIVLIVTHGGSIQDLLMSISEEYKNLILNGQIQSMKECSVTKIILNENKFELDSYDLTTHLHNKNSIV